MGAYRPANYTGESLTLLENFAAMRILFQLCLWACFAVAWFYAFRGEGWMALNFFLAPFVGAVLYFLLVMVAISVCLFFERRYPLWADRLIRLRGRLTGGRSHFKSLFFIHHNNPEKMDQLWQETEPHLHAEPPAVAMALVTNYCPSLAARGEYSRARDLMKKYEATHPSRLYELYHAHYWVNLGWYEQLLGNFEQVDYCIRRAEQEKQITHRLIHEHFISLRALSAYEQGELERVELFLRHLPKVNPFGAWLSCEMGSPPEAKLDVDPQKLQAPQRTYYYLAQASITNDPELLKKVDRVTGLVAYHAIRHFNDSSYLEQALQNDPESIWTRRAQAAGS